MTKVALKKIGFIEQNEVDDTWQQQQSGVQPEPQRGTSPSVKWFAGIDQAAAILEETVNQSSDGSYYESRLSFSLRQEADIAKAKKYARRPVVIYVNAVDGSQYTIGTKGYPATMITRNRFDGTNTREITVEVTYQTLTPVM